MKLAQQQRGMQTHEMEVMRKVVLYRAWMRWIRYSVWWRSHIPSQLSETRPSRRNLNWTSERACPQSKWTSLEAANFVSSLGTFRIKLCERIELQLPMCVTSKATNAHHIWDWKGLWLKAGRIRVWHHPRRFYKDTMPIQQLDRHWITVICFW